MADMNDFQWKWNAANGNDAARLMQIRAANEARIAQLTDELEALQHTDRLTEPDMLDLELASNRARAFDMSNSVGALERIENRRAERNRDAREMFKANQTKLMENDLKISELQKQYQQELNELANSADAHSDATHKTNLQYLGERIKQLGGTVPGGPVETYRTRSDIMNDYWGHTVNTKSGRKFGDTVDDDKRRQLVNDLRSIGEYEKADALQATSTPAEIEKANQKAKQLRRKVKSAVKVIEEDFRRAQKMKAVAKTTDETMAAIQLYKDTKVKADSLVRNYPDLVKADNEGVKYVAKD